MTTNQRPEDIARDNIDRQLKQAGWLVQKLKDYNSINANNTLFHSYSQPKKSSRAAFEQDVIDFIYLDFIRSISVLSLRKPGAIEPQLRMLSKEYKSDIWSALFDRGKNYLRQIDFANLLDTERDTISKQRKPSVNKKSNSD